MSVTNTREHVCQGSTCTAQLGGRFLVDTLSSSVLTQQILNTMASKPFAPLLRGHPADGDSGYNSEIFITYSMKTGTLHMVEKRGPKQPIF